MQRASGRSASGALAAAGCSLLAAVALIATLSLIAEIAAVPTAQTGIDSSFWTPPTAVSALSFDASVHGSFEPLSVGLGWLVIAVASVIAGGLGAALIVYSLGRRPHPLGAAVLGAAWGLAVEILLVNLLLNWLQAENGVYRSLPSWAWFVGLGAWGIILGLLLARVGGSA